MVLFRFLKGTIKLNFVITYMSTRTYSKTRHVFRKFPHGFLSILGWNSKIEKHGSFDIRRQQISQYNFTVPK